MNGTPILRLDDVGKVYRSGSLEVAAVRGVSLTVHDGEFVAIMGPSGSGKSTLMHVIGCLDTPTSGTYHLAGEDVSTMRESALADVRNRRIGFVFQQFNLLSTMSAWRNVELPLVYAGLPRAERKRRAVDALTRVGLADRVDHRPGELSGGQQQRVSVARALVTDPQLILADEPTGNLDSTATADVLDLFDELQAQGRTIVLITHEHDVAARAHREVHMRDGRLLEVDRVACTVTWPETLRTAWDAISTRRMRSALTVLGILIGIAAVMLTVGLGQGAQQQVASQIGKLGSNLLIVSPGSSTSLTGIRGGRGSATTLTTADAAMLADPTVAPDVRAVAPTSSTSTTLTANGTNWTTSVVGTTPDWLQVRARSVASGRMFTEAELASVQPEVVLGSTTADELFGVRDPVGQTVTIGAQPFTVIGVLDTVGSTVGGDQDDQAIVPATTYATLVSPSSGTSVSTIYLEATSPDTLSAAYQEATNALLTTHGVTADTADFSINSQESIVETATSTSRTLTVLLGGIAAISLLVGGIGVMNIMLVSVTERIREIGLRKALGATPRIIRRQFLTEATVLGLIGGLLGLALGVAGSQILPSLLDQPVTVSPLAAGLALAISLVIGVVAGVYPASRAARLSPIDALRSE